MSISKILIAGLVIILGVFTAQAQKAQKSPQKTEIAKVGSTNVTIVYCSPSVRGREIYGDLVPYGKVWRTGANAATTIETTGKLNIGNKTLSAGKYALFTIPGEKSWEIIINSVSDQWGAYKYAESKDVFRVSTTDIESVDATEEFTIEIKDGKLSFVWATTKVSIAAE